MPYYPRTDCTFRKVFALVPTIPQNYFTYPGTFHNQIIDRDFYLALLNAPPYYITILPNGDLVTSTPIQQAEYNWIASNNNYPPLEP